MTTPNQSYLLKQMQRSVAACLGTIMNDLGCNITGRGLHDPWKNPEATIYSPSGWRIGEQSFAFRRHHATTVPLSGLLFSRARWDGQRSKLDYGVKTIDKNINKIHDSKSKIIKNETNSPFQVEYEETVGLTNSFSSHVVKGVVLDVTEDAKASVSATVGAEAYGIKAEATVAAEFGVSESKQESSEEGKEAGEEGTHSETVKIAFEAAPQTFYLVEILSENVDTSQPYNINGVMDWDTELHFKDVPHGSRVSGTVKLVSADGIDQWLKGYDTDYPEMQGYWDEASADAKAAAAWLLNPTNRYVQVSEISHESLDSNATFDVEELGDNVPDQLSHLPIVNARDI